MFGQFDYAPCTACYCIPGLVPGSERGSMSRLDCGWLNAANSMRLQEHRRLCTRTVESTTKDVKNWNVIYAKSPSESVPKQSTQRIWLFSRQFKPTDAARKFGFHAIFHQFVPFLWWKVSKKLIMQPAIEAHQVKVSTKIMRYTYSRMLLQASNRHSHHLESGLVVFLLYRTKICDKYARSSPRFAIYKM